MHRVLYITDPADPLIAKIRQAFDGRVELVAAEANQLPTLSGFDALLIGDGPLSAPIMSIPADGPKLIQLTRGHHRDVDAAVLAASGITVAGAAPALADHIARHVILGAIAVHERSAHPAPETQGALNAAIAANQSWLSACIVGIVGFGRVGRAVAKLVMPHVAKVIYSDIRTAPHGATANTNIRRSTLDLLLSQSDIATLHVQWGPTSNPMLGTRELRLPGKESILVNAADARLVDGKALAHVLDTGQIGGAVLDIEDPQYSRLQGLPNMLITPYNAVRSEAADSDVAGFVVSNIEKALSGGGPDGVIEMIDYPRAGDPAFWSSRMSPRTV